jgi:SOS-response transcriptional repressor LexA
MVSSSPGYEARLQQAIRRHRPRPLVPRHRAVLEFIIAHKRAHDGNSPTVREICDHCGISSTSVGNYALTALARRGFIRLAEGGHSRSIEVIGGAWTYQAPPTNGE